MTSSIPLHLVAISSIFFFTTTTIQLTFRRWSRQFPAIFCGPLSRGVGARSLELVISHLRPRVPAPLAVRGVGARSLGSGHTG